MSFSAARLSDVSVIRIDRKTSGFAAFAVLPAAVDVAAAVGEVDAGVGIDIWILMGELALGPRDCVSGLVQEGFGWR